MKDFIFISDFDGTLTKEDFYQIIINKYQEKWRYDLYKKWKACEITDVEFLGTIFQTINRNEEKILEDIKSIQLDNHGGDFIKFIKNSGGDFLILSAGTQYYIDRLLTHYGITDVDVLSNPGIFENNGIKMIPDRTSPFYSEKYGIDKERVVKSLKPEYGKIFYAGDSEPDYKAALSADAVFAKNGLVDLMDKSGRPYIRFDNFSQVEEYLKMTFLNK